MRHRSGAPGVALLFGASWEPLKQRACWQVVRVMSAELMHANGTNGAIQGVTHERLGQAL